MILFKVGSFRSYSLIPEFFPVLVTFLEGINWDLPEYLRHRLFDVN